MFEMIYIFLNGSLALPPGFPANPEKGALTIATDGGLCHTHALGWTPNVILGDFDSAPPELIEKYKDGSIEFITYPKEKDKTDFQLALELALERLEPNGLIDILGAFGGRWDMTFSNLLAPVALASAEVKAKSPLFQFRDGNTLIYILMGPQLLEISPTRAFNYLSLIPLSPVAHGVTLHGDFQYPLENGSLLFGDTLGLSNKLKGNSGVVSLKKGFLAVFLRP
jgi:thiamine pyrophosphokinase